MFLFFLILAAGLFIFLFIYIKFLEKTSVFFPDPIIHNSNILPFSKEEVNFFSSDKVSLNAWLIRNPHSRYILLYCHGNAGNISTRIEKIELFYFSGLSVFIFDYRGYGKSKGKPSEKGIYLDAEGAYNFLTKELNSLPPIVYGESLGTAAAIYLAAKFKVKGLIIEGGFPSAREMAKHLYPYLPAFFLSLKFNSSEMIKEVKIPKLFFHSKDDEVVPFKLGKKLYELSPSPKKFITLEGNHGETLIISKERVRREILEMLDNLNEEER